MSFRIVPQSSHPSQTASYTSAPSAPGVHDTLRSNLSLTTAAPSSQGIQPLESSHPLESRLKAWRTTQDSFKMQMLQRQFGTAEPVRRGMELKIAHAGEWRPAVLGPSASVHSDILSGRDSEITWEDVYTGNELRDIPDFHTEMEAKMKMNW